MPVNNSLLVRVVLLLALSVLGACGGGSKGSTNVGVSTGVGVTLSSPTGTTAVAAGGTLEIDATLVNDTGDKGVTWVLSGAGSISSSTTKKIVYQAPSGIQGSVIASLTAISNLDSAQSSSVTLTVNGTPIIPAQVLFPANQNVPYGTFLTVAGGTAPYTWALTSGTLPAGLSLNSSTSASIGITGTPSAIGSSSFTLQVTDSAGLKATVNETLAVNAQTACLLQGHFAFQLSGYNGSLPATRVGSINVASDGSVTGVYDYKDAKTQRINQSITSGICKTLTQNRGTLDLRSSFGTETFDYAVDSTLGSGQIEENDGSGTVGSGPLRQQDQTALTQAALAGDFVFGFVGDNGASRRLALIGRLTLDASGTISGGSVDTNDASPVVAGALGGALTAPDTSGRGTATLTVGSETLPIAYYVVSKNLLYVASADTASKTPRVSGRLLHQTGAGALDASALAGPAIVSLFGSSVVTTTPVSTVAAGRLSGAVPASGTVALTLDVAAHGLALATTVDTPSTYTVAANGRGTLVVGSGSTQRSFVLYADGAGGGQLLEPTSTVGTFGSFEPQVGVPYTSFDTAFYIGGTVFATSTSPITLAPEIQLGNGQLSGNVTGSFALDGTTGRAPALVSRAILGGTGIIIYVISPKRLVVLGDGINASNASLSWFDRF
jgi:hypothetical protein